MATGDRDYEIDVHVEFDEGSANQALERARRFAERLDQIGPGREEGPHATAAQQGALQSGIETLRGGSGLSAELAALQSGIASLKAAASSATPELEALRSGIRTLRGESAQLGALQSGIASWRGESGHLAALQSGASTLRGEVGQTAALQSGISTLRGELAQLAALQSGISTLRGQSAQFSALQSGVASWRGESDRLAALQSGINTLRGGDASVWGTHAPASAGPLAEEVLNALRSGVASLGGGGAGGGGGRGGGGGGGGFARSPVGDDGDDEWARNKAILKQADLEGQRLRVLTEVTKQDAERLGPYNRQDAHLYGVQAEIGRGIGLQTSGVTSGDLRDAVASITAENTRKTRARGQAIGEGTDQDTLDELARIKRGQEDIRNARTIVAAAGQGATVDPAVLARSQGILDAIPVQGPAAPTVAQQATLRKQQIAKEAEETAGLLERELEVAKKALSIEQHNLRVREELAAAEAAKPGSVAAGALQHIPQEVLERAQAAAVREASEEARSAQHRATRDYFYDPKASLGDRINAGIQGYAPGGKPTDKTPFGAQFLEGFFGRDSSLELALGQAAKFSLLYGGLYRVQSLVTQGFVAAAQGASQYEEALIALNLATAQTSDANEELARTASQTGTALGYGPAAGVEAAARAVGLYDLNNASPTDRQAIVQQSVEVAGRIGKVSGQDIDTVQQQLAGMIRSFNLSPYDQSNIEDQLTVIQRQTGRNPADILSATTQLGTIAQTAGFDPAQTMAAVAQIATTTGQTANAVAGQLAQVLSRAGDPAVLQRLAAVGVNTQGTTLKEQIEQLAATNLDANTRSYTVQAFGRSRSGQTFDILLNQLGRIDQLAGQARTAEPGTGVKTFNEVMGAAAKQLQIIGGHLQSIANTLADLGFFDVVKAAIGVFGALVEGLDNMLKVVTGILGPFKELVGWTVALAAATRVAALAQGVGGAVSETISGLVAGSALGKALAARGIGGALTGVGAKAGATAVADVGVAGQLELFPASAVGGEAAAGGAAAGGAAAGAGGLALPIAGLLAALYASIQTAKGGIEGDDAVRAANSSAAAAAAAAGTPAELRDAAARYGVAVAAAEHNNEISFSTFMEQGFAPTIRHYLTGDISETTTTSGQAEQTRLLAAAAELDKQQTAAVKNDPASGFSDFTSVEAVSTQLQTMAASGYSAAQQLKAMNEAIDAMIQVGRNLPDAAAVIQAGGQGLFSSGYAATAGKAVASARANLQNTHDVFDTGPGFLTGPLGSWLGIGRAPLVGQTQAELDALGKIDQGALRTSALSDVSSVLAGTKADATGQTVLSKSQIDGLRQRNEARIRQAAKDAGEPKDAMNLLILEGRAAFDELLKNYGQGAITPDTAISFAQNVPALAAAAAQSAAAIARDRTAGPEAALASAQDSKARLTAMMAELRKKDPKNLYLQDLYTSLMGEADAAIQTAIDADTQGRIGDIEAISNARKTRIDPQDQMALIDNELSAYKQELGLTKTQVPTADAASSTGDLPLDPAHRAQLERARTSPALSPSAQLDIQAKIDADDQRKAALQRQDVINKGLLAIAPSDAAGIARVQLGAAQRDVKDAEAALKAGTGSAEFLRQKKLDLRTAQGAKYQADLASQAIDYAKTLDVDDPLASQKTALDAATRQVALGKRGVVDLREAQIAFNKAQHDLIEAQIQLAAETRNDFDRTNPLQQAVADLATLRKEYAAAVNVGEKKRLANQIADKNNQIDITGSEQRIQQIDDYEQLGMISHQAAQASRVAEKNRIDAELAGMTEQTTGYWALHERSIALAKEIKQVSDQYSGQFNLRDIKLPTVYEIRRSIGAPGGDIRNTVGDSVTNNVQINGADFGAVISYLNSILGRTSQPVRGYMSRTVG